MRILYAGTLPPHQGGSAISAAQILTGLARRGHDVHALGPMASGTGGDDAFASGQAEIAVHRFEVPAFAVEPAHVDLAAPLEGSLARSHVDSLLAFLRPDVLFTGRESYVCGCVDAADAAGVAAVSRLAGGWLYQGTLDRSLPPTRCAEWTRSLRLSDLVVVPARHMAEPAHRLGARRVEVVRNSIEVDAFRTAPRTGLRSRLGISPGDVVVTSVANLHERKRPADVLRAAELALAKDHRLRFVFAGAGTLAAELRTQVEAGSHGDRIRFLGWLDYDQIPSLLGLSDMVVLASSSEGLARISLEAQAAGRTLIASDIPPNREVVDDGVNGLLFGLGDVGALAARILTAAADPDLRRRLGAAARSRVEAHRIEDAVARYEELLAEPIGASPARRRLRVR
ncbi:MAG: glycosyltransferase family 4 protein [Thermoanaerobaculia bacterium]|nr:glycosyltransferase family 4 protein [Thermoanaerobaculia bacterium]